jgi:hypothetical protein
MCVDFFDVTLVNHNDEDAKLWRLAQWMCLFAQRIDASVEVMKSILWNVEDHKGILIVIFQNKPDAKLMQSARDAWEQCDEYATQFKYVKTRYEIFRVEDEDGTSI